MIKLYRMTKQNKTNKTAKRVSKTKTGLKQSKAELKAANEQLQLELHQREQVEKVLKTRLRQQAAIAELGQRALVGTTLSILMDEAVSLVAQTLEVEYAEILEFLPGGNTLLLKAGRGWKEGVVGRATVDARSDSHAGYALLTGGPVIIEDLVRERRFNESPLLRDHRVVSGVSIVIQGQVQPFGILGAYTTGQRAFTEDELHFLQAVATVLIAAIERKQAETQIVRRNRELLTLQFAGAAFMFSLDPQYVFNSVAREMTSLLEADTCAISDWNQADDTVSGLARYGFDDEKGEECEVEIYHLAEFPLTKQVLAERQAIQVTISQSDIDPAALAYMQKNKIKTQLMLPMVLHGHTIGLVEIMARRVERTFTDRQIELAKLLANQAAGAIENARLYAETRKMLKEQQALREAGAVISSTLDLETVLSNIVEQMGQAIDATSAYIGNYDPETQTSTVLAEYFGPEASPQEQVSNLGITYYVPRDFPGTIEAWQAGQSKIVHVDNPDIPAQQLAHMEHFGVKTALSIPLQAGGQLIGYADLWESRRRREFTPEEITLCQGIVQQAAVTIENARLFEQVQTALEETDTLYRVTQTLAQMDSEQEMFELVLVEYLQSLNLQYGAVLIIGSAQAYGTLKARMVKGKLVEPGLRIPIAGNLAYDRLIENKEPVVINDIQSDKLLEPVRGLTLGLDIKSMLLVPIIARGKVIGSLEADATEAHHNFTLREIALVGAMANQLSIAIENIRLHAETERRAQQLAVLHELDQAVTSSLRLTDIYDAFARHVTRLLPYDRLSIALREGSDICIAYVVDKNEETTTWPVGAMLPQQTSAMGWVVAQGQPLLRHNIAAGTRFAEDEQLVIDDLVTSMIVPLRIKGEVIGTWNLYSRQVGVYNPDDLRTAQAMADQLAIALDNARLYGEIQQYLEELTTLNMISQTITSTLDLREMLTTITQHAVRLVGVEAVSVVLYDEAKDDLWFAAASGSYEDFVRGMRLKIGQGIAGWVIQQEEAVLVPDVSQDPRFFDRFDQKSGFTTRSILCVPLQTKGQTIGAIEAINKESGPFDQDDRRLLASLAAPAATAIETARLFNLAQQEIAERKRAEAALEEERALLARRVEERTADLRTANRELARAARLKDEFLASMSHELRTPLTAILGLSEVLKTEVYGPLTEKQGKSIQDIEGSGRHLLSLINDILDLSKIEAGQIELQIGVVSIESVCQTSLQFIKQAAHKKQIDVSLTLDSAVSILQADERRLKQILVNLLSNAVKFTPENGAVGLEVVGEAAKQVVHFTVWDTGIGISQEDKDRLFQSFVQLDSSLSRQHSGTGLGLALVRRMVELHNGKVSLESEVGQGSRFTISLPWSEPMQASKPVAAVSPGLDVSNLLPIQRALVIDDSPTTADRLARYLGQLGITTAIYYQGKGAIEKALETRPDVIILDIILPDFSGWDVLTQLKAEERTQTIPVLIVSAMDEEPKGLALGAAECLVKPISQQQLQQALSRIVLLEPEPSEQATLAVESGRDEELSLVESPLILVAEDEHQLSEFLADYLLSNSYRVIVARNGLEALKQAQEERPDVILMDIQMPEMDGLEAIRRLRADAELSVIPVIALTALAMPGDRERCLEAGASDYMSKPINLKQLAKAIETQLNQNRKKIRDE